MPITSFESPIFFKKIFSYPVGHLKLTNFSCSLSYIEKAENLRPANVTKTEGSDATGVVKVRVQGKSIIGDNIVTSDDENENNDAKPIPKTEIPKTAVTAPKLDENQIQNLILTSLKKIVASEATSPQKKQPSVANSGTANKTIARPKFPPRVGGARNAGNSSRQPATGNRNDGGNNHGSGNSLNRSFGGNGNNMLSDFGLNRNLNFGNDIGNNMGSNMGNSMGNNMGGNVGFGGNLRANSSFDNTMMRGGLSNTSDFNSDFSSIGMRRTNMMGLGPNSNSMGSNGRGFDNNNGMGMSGSFSGNMWNSNSSNGGGGGSGSGYNNSWNNGNSNRF